MDFVSFGKTGLRPSVVGLGAGGPSRLGQKTGNSEDDSANVVRRALDLGINFLDTAEAYGTEAIVGKAIAGVNRDEIILSTKKGAYKNDEPIPVAEYVAGVEASLQRLGVDHVDIFHVHGLQTNQIDYVMGELVPALLRLKEQGKIRFLAASESFGSDTAHEAFQRALHDNVWEVAMVGFNILNQSARDRVFPLTLQNGIGTECMFAVRRAFSQPQRLSEILEELIQRGEVDAGAVDLDDPLRFAVEESDAASLAEVAYRFCRYEPGMDVILTGTGNIAHLEENVESLLKPPLPGAVSERLKRIFERVDSVSGT
jgi:aryl-alcohol dehydrogenase-like predicted oxidoreductase